jgi:hypothetical protein
MVIYRGADGRPGYHQADELDDAIHFVEGLRNGEGVEHARIFRMDEVTFEFRPYFRVEIGENAPAPTPEIAEPAPVAAPAEPAVEAAEVAEPAAAAGEWPATDPWADAPDAEMAPALSGTTEAAGNGAAVGRRGLFGR